MNSRENFIGDDQMIRQENVASSQQAKQIALIKWLLVKANRDPEEYREIFQPLPNILTSGKSFNSRLHPKIVNALQSAELYSATLANMNIDHHFYNPDHNRILQVLARKGVVLSDPLLTVSVLLKSDPINLNAHLAVIEAIIVLYAKEIATPDRIYAAIEKLNSPQRYSEDSNSATVIRQKHVNDYEQLLLLWINESVSALNKRIKQELLESQKSEADFNDDYIKLSCKEVSDLSDGIALCALVSFYSPQSLPWRKIRIGKPINTADSLHNLNLFINACQACLPLPLFHMNPQDVLPQAINFMKPNVIALMADLFNAFEISPPRCVLPDDVRNATDFQAAFPSNDQESRTANSSPKTERKIRNSLPDTQTSSEFFVVHKGRNIPTLSSMNPNAGLKERQYEPVAAGKPTNWNDNRKNQMSSCGRRSRRNSFSDDSQLTIENFGGSHENINLLGRNPDKEPAVHVVNSSSSTNVIENNDGSRQLRSQVAAQENWSSAAITKVLFDDSTENKTTKPYQINAQDTHSFDGRAVAGTLPTPRSSNEANEVLESCKVSSQMLDIRLKLEEKRRQMEMEKRRMELNMKKQRQKLNEAAFLQAVSKIENVNGSGSNNDGDGCDELVTGDGNDDSDPDDIDHDSIVMCEDISRVEQRWLRNNDIDKNMNGDSSPKLDGQMFSPDNIDIEKCQKSISEMNSSIDAIQTEIELLNLKESEMRRTNPSILENRHHMAEVVVAAAAEKPASYPVSFMLNQGGASQVSPNQFAQRRVLMNHPNHQSNDLYSNSVEYAAVNDTRGNYLADVVPNKNFVVDYNYVDEYGMRAPHGGIAAHHHSLMSTIPAYKGASPTAAPNVHLPFNSPDMYAYHQHQHLPLNVNVHAQMLPNANANGNENNNYRSMNISHSNASSSSSSSDNKENQILAHQMANEQFYLHKPSENAVMSPFQFQSASPNAAAMTTATTNLDYGGAAVANTTANNAFSQRRTWDSRDDATNISPQPIPPPRMYTSRFSSSNDQTTPVTLTKTFTENKLRAAATNSPKFADDRYNSARSDHSPGYFATYTSSAKKSYSSMHDDSISNANHDLYNLSETDSAPRHSSVGCMSIPSPSVDDMAPQCISFIGTSDESNVTDDCVVDKYTREGQLNDSVNKLNIVNGSRTYRIPSPTNKAHLRTNSNHPFINDDSKKEKGFYVSFSNDDDNEVDNSKRFTERIKAPLRMKRALNSAPTISAKNEKYKANAVKSKFENAKKPETIYNDNRDRSSDSTVEQRLHHVPTEKIMEKASDDTIIIKTKKAGSSADSAAAVGLLINADVNSNDPALVDEMERKKERILLQSLQRRQQQEEMKARKEIETQRRKDKEKQKEEEKAQKKEEEKRRRAVILEKHRLKKMIEEAEREGKPINRELLNAMAANGKSSGVNGDSRNTNPLPKLRSKKPQFGARPRPKTIHIDMGSNMKENSRDTHHALTPTLTKKGSTVNLTEHNNNYGMSRRDYYRGSQDCLLAGADAGTTAGTSASSIYSGSSCDQDSFTYNSRYMTDTDCGLGLVTPPHRTSSPAPNNSSPSGPGSLPPSHHSRRLRYDDTASESGGSEYSGLRLYKQPTVKSNRSILTNAIEYCVFPGEVNRAKKNRLLEEMNRSDGTSAKHFLILFRDAGCQYRALYSYFPENEEVIKVSGVGPRLVTEDMFDKFFKYNSGSKCFAQVHTKHLTVTIDAFTIHNNLWQGKKVNLPNKRDMTLVI